MYYCLLELIDDVFNIFLLSVSFSNLGMNWFLLRKAYQNYIKKTDDSVENLANDFIQKKRTN